ncbi:MAG: hypothetical protein ACI9ON_003100, partial [Limisphaerales bacterium]
GQARFHCRTSLYVQIRSQSMNGMFQCDYYDGHAEELTENLSGAENSTWEKRA